MEDPLNTADIRLRAMIAGREIELPINELRDRLLGPNVTPVRLVIPRDQKAITSISNSQAFALEKLGKFPQKITISPGRTAYVESELHAWAWARINESRAGERVPAGRGKPFKLANGASAPIAADLDLS